MATRGSLRRSIAFTARGIEPMRSSPSANSTSVPLIRGEPSRRSVPMVRCLREVISVRTRRANSGSALLNSAHDAIDSRGQRNLVGIVERPSDPVTVERLRRICLALPEVTEKMSHGEPSWFVGGKQFVTTADHHHDDRLSAWCAAPEGAQEMLVKAAPDRFFRPPYVGHRGWVGVYLDVEVDWEEVGIIVARDYSRVATTRISE